MNENHWDDVTKKGRARAENENKLLEIFWDANKKTVEWTNKLKLI